MPGSVGDWLLWLVVVVFPWLLARRPTRSDLAALVALVNVLYGCALVLLVPTGGSFETAMAAMTLLAINLAAWFAPQSLARRLLILVRWPTAKVMLTLLSASLIPLGLTELVCRVLTEIHMLNYHQPIQTVWRSGRDDWRLATITGDENREPDPVLLWRPVARKPFNSQRFKGPVARIPKPADLVRVMCYGDSLTDGPPKGGWPTWLHVLLSRQPPIPGRRCEVLNAGVAGYSSHQGLLRFRQEVDTYHPDLILVSFGWNDVAEAIGQPDKSFRCPPWPMVLCQRALVRFRTYLVLMYYTRGLRTSPPDGAGRSVHPRVSVEDYLANLEAFRSEAQARGIQIAFLTRPHKLAPSDLRQDPTWRSSVPRYNAALLAWAKSRNVAVIDVQHLFEWLPTALFSDECHFTPQGYQRMAELVRDRLRPGPNQSLQIVGDPLTTAPWYPSVNAAPRKISEHDPTAVRR
jgi:lysophospholipase L1-like esterase